MSKDTKSMQIKVTRFFLSKKEKTVLLEIIRDCLSYGLSVFVTFNEILPSLYKKGNLKVVITDLIESISTGSSLSTSLSYWFGSKVSAIISAGENANNLSESLDMAIESLSSDSSVLGKFFAKISYSLVGFILSFAVLYIFSSEIFPSMLQGMNISMLPYSVRMYIEYYTFSFDGGLTKLLIVLIAIIFLLTLIIKNYTGSLRHRLDTLPIFSMYRKVEAAYYLLQLGYYFKANTLLDIANKKIAIIASRYLRMHCDKVEDRLNEGVDTIVEALDQGLLTEDSYNFLCAMSKVGQFESRCIDFAKKMHLEVVTKAERIGGLLQNLLMIATAVNITWSLSAMYGLTNVIQHSVSAAT
ncbi:MAG: type II secretion system F family protein [Candidatus Lariskella arthropodorum]